MADIQIEIDEAAIDAMARDWESPVLVGRIIEAATERVADYQHQTAPVSPIGSKFAPRGFLRDTIHAAVPDHYDENGVILGLAGTSTNRHGGGYPYPLAFVANASGVTENRGHKSTRRADNRFIAEALASLDAFTYEA